MEILNGFMQPFAKVIPNLPEAILTLLLGMIGIKITGFVIKKLLKLAPFAGDFKRMVISSVKLFLWFLLVIFFIKALGFGNLFVYLSGSAIALAFVLNTGIAPVIGDVISGISLTRDPDFKVGNTVSINEGKTIGVIKSIDVRKVRIIGQENKLHVIPNSLIEKGEWVLVSAKKDENKKKINSFKKLVKK